VRRRLLSRLDPLEHERDRLAVLEHELRDGSALGALERRRRLQREREVRRAEDDPVVDRLDCVLCPRIVEARLHLRSEPELAAHLDHATDEAVAVHARARWLDRHEVLHFGHAVGR
jgi:hypothetical protein